MPKTRLISPGIANHSLKKNLILNNNYISNDGGDEGISIADNGTVTASSQIDIGNMSLTTSELDISSGDFTLDIAGDITLDAGGDGIKMLGSAGSGLNFVHASEDWSIFNLSSDKDTIFGCIDNASFAEVMRIDGSESSLFIASDKKIEFGDAGEYIVGDGTNLDIVSSYDLNLSGDNLIKFYDDTTHYGTFSKSAGPSLSIASTGNLHLNPLDNDYIRLGGGTGFTQVTATFNSLDTDIDFRDGNKQILTLTGNIADVHFQFPAVSCNFLCVFLQDGTGGWDVSNWKTKDEAGNAGNGNSGEVLWPGDSATTLTETADKADIVSIYWDATNEMAYAVASENF